ncbi:hypothetical protein CONPUDRAFT_152261 [Coniophora puteana RWD-64-598 SS2]|uniref:F-box domain-containing protein n=1 Tax=Coniophora puteana (strain RWD-64-598) TaxID=741705 RepID=A0A5M3MW62_CONPW|nr:uncharacterized protein CONPUDRAFT_152261 [Coniophora puteana RWD-64-598 SS2]EIW83227.1 hypothetical protein CONPUDRAFT_152261 [Coniophora puteana RWD-64-598 SS2]
MEEGPPTFDYSQRSLATRSIEDIDTELAMLTSYASVLRNRRNSLVAISKLPSEILAAIFQACADTSHGSARYSPVHVCSSPCLSWISATYVCRFWRSVALDHPTLWSQLPCFHRRWTNEFLMRAKSAPLIIRAAASASASVLWGPSGSVKTALAHIAQTRELTLMVPSKELLEQLLNNVRAAAPTLESLLLKSSHNGFHVSNYAYHVPMQLFLGATPRLRRLSLYKCNIDWNSPLLTNLTHLCISDIAPALRPSIDALAETLSRMPALEDLILEDFLSQVSPPTSPPQNHTRAISVKLPRLSRLHIHGSVTDAASVFSILRLTQPLEHLSLHCTHVGSPKQDFAALQPIIATLNHDSDTHPSESHSQTSPPPSPYSHSPSRLSFGSTSQRCTRLIYTSWPPSSPNPDPSSDLNSNSPNHPPTTSAIPPVLTLPTDSALLRLTYDSPPSTAPELIAAAASAVDLGAVTHAELSGNGDGGGGGLPGPCYAPLLVRLHSLETLRASHVDVETLTLPLLPRAAADDPTIDGLNENDGNSNGDMVIAAPSLRKLSLSRVYFGAESGLNIGDMPALAACIAQRRQYNSLLDKLELRKCWNFAMYDWASLKGLVVDLDWDHIERWEDEVTVISDSSDE